MRKAFLKLLNVQSGVDDEKYHSATDSKGKL